MEDHEIVLPEIKEIIIGDRKYILSRLSLSQELRIGRFVAKTILTSKNKMEAIAERTKDTTSNIEDVLSILDLLDDEDISRLFSIILKENDIEFLKNNLDSANCSGIIADVIELNQNKIETVKKNLQRIKKYIAPLIKKSGTVN